MPAISDEPERVKVVHTYGVGLHTDDPQPDHNDARWQRRQIHDFVEFAAEAESLGFDGVTVTEHHAQAFTCPAPHLLLAAAAARTSRIRLGTAVTVLPLYNPIRVAEEAGTLDLLSDGRFELGLGRGIPGEVAMTLGQAMPDEDTFRRRWLEALELVRVALTERRFTFDGEFWQVTRPTTIATRPLQEPLPVWLGGASLETTAIAARNGWNIMRNHGTVDQHRAALAHLEEVGREHGHGLGGANCMVERFVAIAETEEEAGHNLRRMVASMDRFIAMYLEPGGKPLETTDGEVIVTETRFGRRPAIAVVGTPDQVREGLLQTLEETGARRLLVETFSPQELRLFAEEVLPALQDRAPAEVG
jgi:alkanesulfonate monooxygenase SsuD/methylene tetrahydromethanopterin reductase-like flavin-dependent oxidoreductase (luciferase family)